jgi:hypothetical protein
LGSASLRPEHPELGDSGGVLELTADADFLLEPVHEAITRLESGRDGMQRGALFETYLAQNLTAVLEA